jgi:hypothetical protein
MACSSAIFSLRSTNCFTRSGSGDRFGIGHEEVDDAVDGGLGATAEVHGVAPCCDVLDALGV